MDLPGFGHSPMPREQITISGYARLLDGLLDELQIDAAAVVGNSMGGFVSTELAIAFPQRVERLVLVSAAGLSTYHHSRRRCARRRWRTGSSGCSPVHGWLASNPTRSRGDPAAAQAPLGQRHPPPRPAAARARAEQVRGGGKPGFIGALRALATYSVRDRLPEIACPTLIVWGEHDRMIPARDADVYAELIPDSRKVVFEDTAHLAMLERPDAFNSLLREFLSE